MKKGTQVDPLLADLEDELVREIHKVVPTFPATRTAYCLALNYGDAGSSSIPCIGLGFLDPGEVVEVPRGKIPPDEEWKWNPAEYSSFAKAPLSLRTDRLLALDAELKRRVQAGVEIDTRALANRLAVRLNALAWDPLPVSDGFIVFAVDDDLADLEENLRIAQGSATRPRPRSRKPKPRKRRR